ncbi:hypothetical protein K525DRAFT_289210 [Schizophyllum commune Loenen D]|nr:hypothetical protein K525DRAFT_289210 [Schizophyllum commune Loenen D]
MFKRVERKRKRREEEEELGIDEEMKEALGMGGLDTDSDESESDSDSDHPNDEGGEDADEVLEGVDGEDDDEEFEGDDASDADEGDSPTDPAADVFTIGELMSSSPIVQLPDKGGHFTCVVCPGKVLRTKEFIDQHLESQPHTRRMARLASYVKAHKPDPNTDAFDILDKVDEEKEQATPAPGTSKKRRAEARARKQAKVARAKPAGADGADGADDAEKTNKTAKTSDTGADAKPPPSKKKHVSASRQRRIERRAAARAAGESGESSTPTGPTKEKEPLKETQATAPKDLNGKTSKDSPKKSPMSVTKRAAAAIAKSKSGDKKDKPAKKRKLSHA